MEDIYGKVYWVSAKAEAYYSGNSVQDGIFVSKELWDQIDEEELCGVWYYELDGKYSEVEAEVSEVLLEDKNLYSVLIEYHKSNQDPYRIFESYLYEQDPDLVEKIEEFHYKFVDGLVFTTTVTITMDGKEIKV